MLLHELQMKVLVIKDIHASIYFWGAVAVLFFMFFVENDYIQINFEKSFKLKDPYDFPVDDTPVKIMCWNQITQSPRECK